MHYLHVKSGKSLPARNMSSSRPLVNIRKIGQIIQTEQIILTS